MISDRTQIILSTLCYCFRNGYYAHPGTHIDPGGGQWHEPVPGAGGEAGHVPREGSPNSMGHHYQHLQTQSQQQQQQQQQGMYSCKMQGAPPR